MNNSGDVYVYNKNKEVFVATEVALANTYLRRLVGLLGKTRKWIHPGHGLWIVPSHGVHTIGMLFPIDLIFLDQARRVVHLAEHVRPFLVTRVCLKAHSVLELPPHTIFRTGTEVGDQLVVGTLRAVSGNGRSPRQSQDEQTRTRSVAV